LIIFLKLAKETTALPPESFFTVEALELILSKDLLFFIGVGLFSPDVS
jgi:hypothetical protein